MWVIVIVQRRLKRGKIELERKKSQTRHGFLNEFDDKNRVVIYNGDR